MSRGETRDRILERARELFNERGLDAVGVRELARDLGLSPGNLSYWFPRKEDLVSALFDQLRARNAGLMAEIEQVADLDALLERYRDVFASQHEWRFLARALPDLVQRDPELARRYREVEEARRTALVATFRRLERAGELAALDRAALGRIVGICTLVARFWVAEVALSRPGEAPERAIRHYLALLAHALLPHATMGGRLALGRWLRGAFSPLA